MVRSAVLRSYCPRHLSHHNRLLRSDLFAKRHPGGIGPSLNFALPACFILCCNRPQSAQLGNAAASEPLALVLLCGCRPTGIIGCQRADDGEPAALRRRLEAQEPGVAGRVKQEPVDGPALSPAPRRLRRALSPALGLASSPVRRCGVESSTDTCRSKFSLFGNSKPILETSGVETCVSTM